jgi:hypothetical protein
MKQAVQSYLAPSNIILRGISVRAYPNEVYYTKLRENKDSKQGGNATAKERINRSTVNTLPNGRVSALFLLIHLFYATCYYITADVENTQATPTYSRKNTWHFIAQKAQSGNGDYWQIESANKDRLRILGVKPEN